MIRGHVLTLILIMLSVTLVMDIRVDAYTIVQMTYGGTPPLWEKGAGQSFTTGAAGGLIVLKVCVSEIGGTGTGGGAVLKIYEGEGVSGTVIYERSGIVEGAHGDPLQWTSNLLDATPILKAGTKYTFTLVCEDNDQDRWGYGGSAYGGGQLYEYASGNWDTFASDDLAFQLEIDTSLPVTLSSFSAVAQNDALQIMWRTETEVNNLGFGIYRSESEDEGYSRIGFVRGIGNSAVAQDYVFVDAEARVGKTYFYYLEQVDTTGERTQSEVVRGFIGGSFRLFPNYPNPFNPETWIAYELASDSDVVIRIHDLLGNVIRELQLGHQPAGRYVDRTSAAHWDGKSQAGEPVAGGIYFYQLQAGDFTATRRMVIVK